MGIHIIDEIMGRGKTSAMINFVNASSADDRFLFIVPYLTEVDRIEASCAGRNFQSPEKLGGKLNNIKALFAARVNIASTHALFSMFDDDILTMIKDGGYTLIMDEVACVIASLGITSFDANILDEYISIDNSGIIEWTEREYTGKFDDYKSKIDAGRVYAYNDDFWMALMQPEMFTAFRDVYIMTYMFEHQMQRCYFDLKGLSYDYLHVGGNSPDTYHLSDTPTPTEPLNYKNLIHILDVPKLNNIGGGYYDLSKAWYVRNSKGEKLDALRNNTYNFFRNYAKTKSSENLWTTFCKDEEHDIDWPKLLSGKGYAKGFLSCNAKGTNEYRDRTSAAYLINCFPNTGIKNFLAKNDIHLDRDRYALSEMIQWIWRTAIRDGQEINLYVPSCRMRTLLQGWLEEVSRCA